MSGGGPSTVGKPHQRIFSTNIGLKPSSGKRREETVSVFVSVKDGSQSSTPMTQNSSCPCRCGNLVKGLNSAWSRREPAFSLFSVMRVLVSRTFFCYDAAQQMTQRRRVCQNTCRVSGGSTHRNSFQKRSFSKKILIIPFSALEIARSPIEHNILRMLVYSQSFKKSTFPAPPWSFKLPVGRDCSGDGGQTHWE